MLKYDRSKSVASLPSCKKLISAAFGASAALWSFDYSTYGQNVYNYYNGTTATSNAYMNASHWTLNGATSAKFPGVDNNTSSTADGAITDVAAIGAINFSAGNGLGINFNSSSVTGVTANTGANGGLSLGAFDFLSALGSNLQIGNSAGLAGILTLNGDSLNGAASTIIANEGARNITFAPAASGTTTTPMTLALGNSTDNVIQINNTGNISVTTTISGTNRQLTKAGTGAGNLILTGANGYTGGTNVNGGVLLANNTSGSATGTGAVTVAAGATLGGSGVAGGALTVNATTAAAGNISPGASGLNSVGTLSNGKASATFSGGSNLTLDLNAVTSPTADQLDVGALSVVDTIGGVTQVNLILNRIDSSPAKLGAGTSFTIIKTTTNFTTAGTDPNGTAALSALFNIPTDTAGSTYASSEVTDGTYGGYDIVLTSTNNSAELGSISLFGTAITGLVLSRRRRATSC